MVESDSPLQLKRAVVAIALRCRGCGHNIRGVRLDSACPECGLPVETTVNDAVDPTSTNLPKLHRPSATGNAILWLMVCLLAGCLLAVAAAGTTFLSSGGWQRPERSDGIAARLLLGAAILTCAAIVSTFVFVGPIGVETDTRVRRRSRMIGAGLIGTSIALLVWSAEIDGWWDVTSPGDRTVVELLGMPGAVLALRLAIAACGVLVFHGAGGILSIIGERSRVYREAQGGRQGARAMIAACAGIASGGGIRFIGNLADAAWLRLVGDFLVVSSTLMILIGLAYLVVNAWWIRTALRKPSLRVRDVVRIEPDTTYAAAQERVMLRQPPVTGTEAGPPTRQ